MTPRARHGYHKGRGNKRGKQRVIVKRGELSIVHACAGFLHCIPTTCNEITRRVFLQNREPLTFWVIQKWYRNPPYHWILFWTAHMKNLMENAVVNVEKLPVTCLLCRLSCRLILCGLRIIIPDLPPFHPLNGPPSGWCTDQERLCCFTMFLRTGVVPVPTGWAPDAASYSTDTNRKGAQS